MRLVVVSLTLLLTGLLAGCSGGSDGSDGEPAGTSSSSPSSESSGAPENYDAEKVEQGIAFAFAGTSPTEKELEAGGCFAEELMSTATPAQLADGGLVAEDGGGVDALPPLPEDLAELAADATLACIDVVQSSTDAVTSVRKGDLDPEAYAACLEEAVPADAQREALVATLAGRYQDEAVTRLGQAQADCAAEQQQQ